MHQIRYYLDHAKRALGVDSDRQLGIHLGFSSGCISQFRRGVTLPSDENIVRIAEVAGLDPREALLALSVRRTSGKAKQLWLEIAAGGAAPAPPRPNGRARSQEHAENKVTA